MLKINLLPTKRESATASTTSADGSTTFIIAMVAMLALLAAFLGYFHNSESEALAAAGRRSRALSNEVDAIKARVADHDRIRTQLQEIHAREAAIQKLEAARSGPTSMLIELSQLLSPSGHPTTDPVLIERMHDERPGELPNANWDTHRLWLSRFSEEHRAVQIEGDGRTADDVGEFMRRMIVSQYFEDVRLQQSESGVDAPTKIGVQRFRIDARVRY